MSRKIDLIASVLAGEKPGSLARLSARRLVDALEAQGFSIVPTPKETAREELGMPVRNAYHRLWKYLENGAHPETLDLLEILRASLSLPPAGDRG